MLEMTLVLAALASVGLVVLLATLLTPPVMIMLAVGALLLGLAVGMPTGFWYHVALYRIVSRKVQVPRMWWLSPSGLHVHLTDAEQRRIKPWYRQGGVLHEVRGRVDDAGDDRLAVGHADALEDSPLVGVTRVGSLEGHGPGAAGEDNIEDVRQRDVVVMRALVVAPAEVHAHLVRRHRRQRVVESLDVQPGHRAELLEAQVGELDVTAHREIRAIDLEDEPRARHRLILVLHSLGDGEEICLVARVVLVVEEKGDDSGGGCREERLRGRDLRDGGPEVGDVGARRLGVLHGNRFRAGRRPPPRAARVPEYPARHPGEVHEVPVLQRLARAGEPPEAVLDVGGVARLAVLAVVDDVDADLDLLANDLRHRRPDPRGEGAGIDGDALLLREHRPRQVIGTRQAPRVGGQDALGAAFHGGGAVHTTGPGACH